MKIRLQLKSAATFGRGDGVAGLVDGEIEHDRFGFPFLRGRTLKGLLAESAENIVYTLELQHKEGWRTIQKQLFGDPGRGYAEQGILRIGDACLPQAIRYLVQKEQEQTKTIFTQENVLQSLTGIRKQTAVNHEGGSEHASLRAIRVLLPEIILHAPLSFRIATEPTEKQLAFLTATLLDLRHAGTGRNRGRGWLEADLMAENEIETDRHFQKFADLMA